MGSPSLKSDDFFSAIFSGMVLLTALTPPVASQETFIIDSEPSFAMQDIHLTHLTTLRPADEQVTFSVFSRVVADGAGNFFVGPTARTGQVAKFDESGSFDYSLSVPTLDDSREPSIRMVRVGSGGSIHVFTRDWQFHFPSGKSAPATRTLLPLIPNDVAWLETGAQLLQAPLFSSGRKVDLVHVISENGKIIRSFGSDGSWWTLDRLHRDQEDTRRHLSPYRQGVWLGHANEYHLEWWNADGSPGPTIRREANWFQPWHGLLEGEGFEEKPRPRLGSLFQTTDSLLWVILLVPDRHWVPRPVSLLRKTGLSAVFDSIIEVIDLNHHRLITSQRFDAVLRQVGHGDAIYTLYPERGRLIAKIWRPSVLKYPE